MKKYLKSNEKMSEDYCELLSKLIDIIDPDDINNHSEESVLKSIKNIMHLNDKCYDLIKLIYENDSVKPHNYGPYDDALSIEDLLEKTFLELRGYKIINKR